MAILIKSFSYKYGAAPTDCAVFDCRHLPNPYNVPKLKPLTGLDTLVQTYVLGSEKAASLAVKALQQVTTTQRVAFGCHGGKHRSVAMAEFLGRKLREHGYEVEIQHLAL